MKAPFSTMSTGYYTMTGFGVLLYGLAVLTESPFWSSWIHVGMHISAHIGNTFLYLGLQES